MPKLTDLEGTDLANFQMNLAAGRWIMDVRREMGDLRTGPLSHETALAFHGVCKALKNLANVTDRQLTEAFERLQAEQVAQQEVD